MKTVRKILAKPANEISESMHLDLNSKKIKFIELFYKLRVSHILATDDFHYFPPAISEFNV